MTHFSHDYEQGIKDERERIVKLLENAISENGKDSWLDAIELIKAESDV